MSSMGTIQEMGIKDLEHVVLKAKEDMILGDRFFEAGEPVLYFRNIQISLLSEDTRIIAAQGGFLNQPRVVWEDRNNTAFQFSNGTLNPISLNLLLQANIFKQQKAYIPFQEIIEVEWDLDSPKDTLSFILKHNPVKDKKRFYYGFTAENLQQPLKVISETTKKNEITGQTKTTVVVDTSNLEVKFESIMADYYFISEKEPIIYSMDRERKPNLYSLEATFYLKDENEGQFHTGILEMPKVYITSNINLRMGERADPTVGTFRIIAMPENYDNYDSVVWRLMYLEDDIYGI